MYVKLNHRKIKIKEANSFSDRLFGLMGKKTINEGMLFPNCNSIHTFFMKSNIDVLGLDENNQVIYIYRDLPKNKVIKVSKQKNTSILELPNNTSKNISIGSVIEFLD